MRATVSKILIAALAAASFTAAAQAGPHGNGHGGNHGGFRGGQMILRNSGPAYYGNNYGRGYSSWISPSYYGGYYGGWGHGRWTSTDSIVLGVGLGVLGLALATSGKNNDRDRVYNDSANNRDWVNPDGYSYDRSYNYPGSYAEPAYDPAMPAARDQYRDMTAGRAPQDVSCLQTREYQTTIKIDGQNMRAYGTACLQPDGTWRQGPPVAEPRD